MRSMWTGLEPLKEKKMATFKKIDLVNSSPLVSGDLLKSAKGLGAIVWTRQVLLNEVLARGGFVEKKYLGAYGRKNRGL